MWVLQDIMEAVVVGMGAGTVGAGTAEVGTAADTGTAVGADTGMAAVTAADMAMAAVDITGTAGAIAANRIRSRTSIVDEECPAFRQDLKCGVGHLGGTRLIGEPVVSAD